MSDLSRLPDFKDWNKEHASKMRTLLGTRNLPTSSKDLKGDLAIKLATDDWAKYKVIASEIAKSLIMPRDIATSELLAQQLYKRQEKVIVLVKVAKQSILMHRHGRIATQTAEMMKQADIEKCALLKELHLELGDYNRKAVFATLDDDDEYLLNLGADDLFAKAAELANPPLYPPLELSEKKLLSLSSILKDETEENHVLMVAAHISPVLPDNAAFHNDLIGLVNGSISRYYIKTSSDEHGHYVVILGDRIGAEKALEFKRNNTRRPLHECSLKFSFFPSGRLIFQQGLKDKKKGKGEKRDEEPDHNDATVSDEEDEEKSDGEGRIGKNTDGYLKTNKAIVGHDSGVKQPGVKRARGPAGDKHDGESKGESDTQDSSKPTEETQLKSASKKAKMGKEDE